MSSSSFHPPWLVFAIGTASTYKDPKRSNLNSNINAVDTKKAGIRPKARTRCDEAVGSLESSRCDMYGLLFETSGGLVDTD
jgi:hypothetical protein